MILTTHLTYLKFLLRLLKYIAGTPVYWNERLRKVSLSTNRYRIWAFRVSLVVHTIYILGMVGRLGTKTYDFTRTMIGITYMVIIGGEVGFRWNWKMDTKYVDFVNTMITWEKRHIKVMESKPTKLSVTLIVMLFILAAFPIAYYPVVLLLPCNPPFLASWLPECSGQAETTPPLITTAFLAVIDMFVYLTGNLDFNFNAMFCVIIGNICLGSYFDFVFKDAKTLPVYKQLKEYQSLQILVNTHNSYFRYSLTPMILMWTSWIAILLSFGAIKTLHEAPLPIIFNFTAGTWVACMNLILAASQAAKVYTKSIVVLQSLKWQGGRVKWLRIKVRSLSCTKIHVNDNFIDATTPLVVQDFCARQSLSMILVSYD